MVLDSGEYWEPEDFQLEVVQDIFAGVAETWMLVAEGNGKSTLMGGLALYHADYTPDASVLLAAASRDQCGILLGQAAGFVRRSPGMLYHPKHHPNGRFRVFEGYRRIKARRSDGVIQVHAADDRTGDGVIFTMALIDELHRHRDMKLYRTWLGKLGKRGGQIVVISTSGEPGGEFEETVRVTRAAGKFTATPDSHERVVVNDMVMHRWALADDGDPEDFVQVKRANPFSGVTLESLESKRAKPTMTPSHWRRFTCNQPSRGDDSAISGKEWAAAETHDRPREGASIFGVGMDLGWSWDTTAIVPLWVPAPGRRVLLDPVIITPPRDGTSTPPSKVHQALRAVHARNPFSLVAIDRAAGGEQLSEWIEQELGCDVVVYTNGYVELSRCSRRFFEGLRAEPAPTLQHTGDPELTRHVLNARARVLPQGDVIFDRPVHSRSSASQDKRVIDGLSAAQIIHDQAVTVDLEPPPPIPMAAWR